MKLIDDVTYTCDFEESCLMIGWGRREENLSRCAMLALQSASEQAGLFAQTVHTIFIVFLRL